MVLVVFLVVGATLVGVMAWARRGPALAGATNSSTGFYLVVGASASLGFQPTGIVGHNGARTNTGYANDVVAMEARRGIDLSLRQIGCPGETTYSMLHTGDHCYTGSGSQRRAAAIYLGAHHDEAGLVSIDLGFNDVRTCLWRAVPDQTCFNSGLAQIRANLPAVLTMLKGEVGAHTHFVGLIYADPFLADYLKATSSPAAARETLVMIHQLDAVLTGIYLAANVPVANVAGAYRIDNENSIAWNNQTLPMNVYYACSWTWMCRAAPWGPDDHPNNEGYRAIANAIMVAVPTSL
jgi:hypothetical protein